MDQLVWARVSMWQCQAVLMGKDGEGKMGMSKKR
jgi:hypothetical protein